ncbi:MAG: hypothetical protein IID03_11400 [Candidatus Dadabacteria bacterium]|nr:hypothetical protein [Candidatus Dadabacteria bacterium]
MLAPLSFADQQYATEKFQAVFCKLDPAKQSHPIIPADVYKDAAGKEFACGDLTYRVKVISDEGDAGHTLYNVDPPGDVKNALDCDAKADVGMRNIALNCMPISEETTEHVNHNLTDVFNAK